jgi:hypothetical protein
MNRAQEQFGAARGADANRYWLGRWKESMNGLTDEVLEKAESANG